MILDIRFKARAPIQIQQVALATLFTEAIDLQPGEAPTVSEPELIVTFGYARTAMHIKLADIHTLNVTND